MVAIPKPVSVLSCGFLMCLWLSTAAQAEHMKTGQSEGKGGQTDQKEMTVQKRAHIIQGDVVARGIWHLFRQPEGRQGSRFGS